MTTRDRLEVYRNYPWRGMQMEPQLWGEDAKKLLAVVKAAERLRETDQGLWAIKKTAWRKDVLVKWNIDIYEAQRDLDKALAALEEK